MKEGLNPAEKEKIIHNSLLEYIKKNPKGLTMTELVEGTGFSRKAIEKHLQVLILENEIYMKKFGVTKAYYPNHRIQHFDFEKLPYDNKIIWFDVLEGEQGLYLLIQKKKKSNGEWRHEHSITVPLDQGERFIKVLDKILNSKRTRELLKRNKGKKLE
jgi:DNA-binding cell septation regulator SpoVG